jgi:hypothetical protein
MAEEVEQVSQTTVPAEPGAGTTQVKRQVTDAKVSGAPLAARVVWYIAGILLVLLALRFVLALLGANPNNGFANFIYDVSHPFVSPFFSLFGYHLSYGVSRFEIYTLVAMAIYALIAWGITKLLTINRPQSTV